MENKENNNPQKKFNFNSYWIYGIIILAILAVNLSVSMSSKTEEISMGQLERMAEDGDIDSMIIINNHEGHIYVRSEVLEDKYPNLTPSVSI